MRWAFITIILLLAPRAYSQTNSLSVNLYAGLTITGTVSNNQIIQYSADLFGANWQTLTNFALPRSPYIWFDLTPCTSKRFYRIVTAPMTNMVLIPAGAFQMGDVFGDGSTNELPVHQVYVSAFYVEKYLVTKTLWDEVKVWNGGNGYAYSNTGQAKAINHPVHSIGWYDAVKWCNARSQMEGLTPCYYTDLAFANIYKTGNTNPRANLNANGYRLPTEAEWEKAARGGVAGKRFPWGNMITHSNANYLALNNYWYDLSPTQGPHPDYDVGVQPYSNPIGAFLPNDYGLYDMVGGLPQWCWDIMNNNWYQDSMATQDDTSGPIVSSEIDPNTGVPIFYRALRGGLWNKDASRSRVSARSYNIPYAFGSSFYPGFRCVLKYEN